MFKESDKLKQLLAEIEDGSIIDYQQPETSVAEMKKRLEKELILDEEFIETYMGNFIRELSDKHIIKETIINSFLSNNKKIEIEYNENKEFQQLLKLFKEIDRSSVGKTIKIIDSVNVLGSHNEELSGYSFVSELEGLTGERLVRKVMTIAPNLIESGYKQYLHFLVCAKYALDGSTKEPDSKLGIMIDQTTSLRKDYPHLIDKDIAWLRNSMAHFHWRYDTQSNIVIMWSDSHPKTSFSPEEISYKLIGAYLTSTKVFFDACRYHKSSHVIKAIS